MSAPRKAEWALAYDDGSEKITVGYDLTIRDGLSGHIKVEMGSDQWVYIDAADVPWLCARLLDASAAIARGESAQ